MAQTRDILIKTLEMLQNKFPEFADILEDAIDAIEDRYIDMEQEKEYW